MILSILAKVKDEILLVNLWFARSVAARVLNTRGLNKQEVIFKDLGQMAYKEAWDYQEQLLQENVRRKAINREASIVSKGLLTENRESSSDSDRDVSGLSTHVSRLTSHDSPLTTHHYFLLVEHPPVYTLGKSGDMGNVLLSEEHLKMRGIDFFRTNRGGDITFHGPQQIVGYPILDLEKFYTDIGKYLRNIEEVVIRTLDGYGIKGDRSPGETGVWINPQVKGKERKIAAIGVRSSRWVTMHGFALNVNTDLDYFNFIIPCGIQNKQVTSIEKELGHAVDFEEAKERVKRSFEEVFDVKLRG